MLITVGGITKEISQELYNQVVNYQPPPPPTPVKSVIELILEDATERWNNLNFNYGLSPYLTTHELKDLIVFSFPVANDQWTFGVFHLIEDLCKKWQKDIRIRAIYPVHGIHYLKQRGDLDPGRLIGIKICVN